MKPYSTHPAQNIIYIGLAIKGVSGILCTETYSDRTFQFGVKIHVVHAYLFRKHTPISPALAGICICFSEKSL